MRTLDLDLFTGVVPFIETVERGSVRSAARHLGVTPSAVSKAIARLEETLGVRLLHRTTRSLRLTTEGESVFELYREAVARAVSAREIAHSAQSKPAGLLRVSAPLGLGRTTLAPALPRFLARYPDLNVQLLVTDRFVSFADDNVDALIRIGEPDSAEAKTRRIARTRWVTIASPGYLARNGTPRSPADLSAHNCMRFVPHGGVALDWEFKGARSGTRIAGNVVADHGESLIAAAIAGLGLVQALDFMVRTELSDGTLVEVLRDHSAEGPSIWAVAAPRRSRSPKVRAFMEFAETLL